MRPLAAPLLVVCALALACTDPPAPEPANPAPASQRPAIDEAPAPSPTPAPTPAPTPEDEPVEPPPAPVGFMPEPPAFDGLPLTARLPADALGLVAMASPADLARRIGWLAALDALGPAVARDRAEVKQHLGHDIFDPAAWAAAGIAPDRPAGVALLSVEPPILAVAVSVKNHETLRTVLLALAAGVIELQHVTEGDLHLLHGDGFAFGLKPGEGWVVIGDRLEPGEALHHARALARKPASTLLARPTVGAVIGRLNYGRDVAAIVNLPAIFDTAVRSFSSSGQYAELERRLAGAEALGDAEAVAAVKGELDRLRARSPRMRGSELAVGMVLRGYLAPFGGLAVGANIEEKHVQLRFTHHLDRASPVGRVFAKRSGPPVLRDAFARDPAGLAELKLNPVELWELVRSLATATGSGRELSRVDSALSRATGKDLTAVLGLLAGDLGGAAEVDPARVTGAKDPEALLRTVRFAGYAGLTDPDGAIALIERIVAISEGELSPLAAPPDAPPIWRLAIDPLTAVRITVVGSRLLVSLDDETLARLGAQVASGQVGDGFIGRRDPTVGAMFDGRDGGWSGWLDIAALGPLMIGDQPLSTAAAPPPGDDPRTALLTGIAALDDRIRETRRAHRAAEVKRGRALLSTLGRVAANVRPADDGLDGRAGLYVGAPSVAAAVLAFVTTIRTSEEASRIHWSETLGPLFEKQRALRRQLDALDAAPVKP